MKNRLEIIEEVYGKTEWSSAAIGSLIRCIEIAQDEVRKQMELSITDPENQPSQYGTVPLEAFENAIWVLDKLWDKKSGKEITRRWAGLLSEYGKELRNE